ncbi:Cgl0159 family (beta/alpha)8-fold protein [Cryptosporangium phraense]|uniref:Aldolase n=1 Tax=Cryptosporangium phraense TaxID=2593070 RepID=A0A545ATX2_9ACTN|nr:aldolase [Cryptosporangium phraense]TQS44774.1 aldolase [Cryptosporangium phraense]
MSPSAGPRVTADDVRRIVRLRLTEPDRIAALFAARERPRGPLGDGGRLLMIAADHPARGALAAGGNAAAMGDRAVLLDRIVRALARPGVNGFLGTADVIEDLLVLGALEGKVVLGSMNRGGLAGSVFEVDDRFTGYDAAGIAAAGLEGGKMLLRIDPDDPATVRTLESSATAVRELAYRRLVAMVEPFLARRTDGRLVNDLSTEAVVRSAVIAAGLGSTSAYTWLKLPVTDDMEPVLAATTLPVLLLGGEVGADQQAQFATWAKALADPAVVGMAVGRSLLFPPDGDVEAAVDATADMLEVRQ